MLFLSLLDLNKIVPGSLKYQLLLVLEVSVKKNPKCFILYYFFMKNSCFWHKNPFLIFFAQVRSKWISESCSTAFIDPLCKNLGWVHFFLFL